MPGPKPQTLTKAQVKRLRAAKGRILASELAWAKVVRELGISAVARHEGITSQSLGQRVRLIERHAGLRE